MLAQISVSNWDGKCSQCRRLMSTCTCHIEAADQLNIECTTTLDNLPVEPKRHLLEILARMHTNYHHKRRSSRSDRKSSSSSRVSRSSLRKTHSSLEMYDSHKLSSSKRSERKERESLKADKVQKEQSMDRLSLISSSSYLRSSTYGRRSSLPRQFLPQFPQFKTSHSLDIIENNSITMEAMETKTKHTPRYSNDIHFGPDPSYPLVMEF